MPNKEHILEWVNDLENGGHEQGERRLHTRGARNLPDSFCCLGRACVLSGAEGTESERFSVVAVGYGDVGNGTDPFGFAFDVVGSWLGISSEQARRYADMNDQGESFRQIAAQVRADFGLPPSPPQD